MKNLLIYYNPEKKFTPVGVTNYEELTKIQIDNSLELGWKVEDIILVMNFDFEYRGVKALVLDGDFGVRDGNRSSKLPMIVAFLKSHAGDGVYWFHDHDAFQLQPFNDFDMGGTDIAYTDHGWTSMWNAGSFFFKKGALDVFEKSSSVMYERGLNEQTAFIELLREDPEIMRRCKKLNLTYNFGIYYHPRTYPNTDKPLKVAHFHPHKPRHLALYTPLITDRLKGILSNYGLTATKTN